MTNALLTLSLLTSSLPFVQSTHLRKRKIPSPTTTILTQWLTETPSTLFSVLDNARPTLCRLNDARVPRTADTNLNRRFAQKVLIDTTPLPDSIPKVKEIGSSSAPLLSAAFFIGARCRDYNDDYMQCKNENPGKGEFECLKEGRRVTRCARSVYVCNCFPEMEGEKRWRRVRRSDR